MAVEELLQQPQITIRQLVDGTNNQLALNWLAGISGADISLQGVCQAGADWIGYFNFIHPARIQVFGLSEYAFFAQRSLDEQHSLLNLLQPDSLPAMMIGDGVPALESWITYAETHHIPLLTTETGAAFAIDQMRTFLAKRLALSTTRHGVLLDVFGMGILLTGESGLGKSELALELISRGHGLVADDVVELSRIAPQVIEGRCPPLLENLIEVRGMGLLDMKAIFGETAVRRKMRLRLVAHLYKKNQQTDAELNRLPIDELTETILGLPIPKVMIPVAAGRNIAVLIEAATRNTILRMRGVNTMQDFIHRQRMALLSGEMTLHNKNDLFI
jgi:HPr kinase/phosphorylase